MAKGDLMYISVYNMYILLDRLSALSNIRFFAFLFTAVALVFYYVWYNM